MTARQLFEYALVELNKVQAPSLLLEDYNYFINKAVNQYINKVYNMYDVNQQKSDDLRVLKSTAVLIPSLNNDYAGAALFNKTYEVELPDDYLHVLNCLVEYSVNKTFKCYNAGDKWQQGAKRLTADMFSQIINNHYMRPSYKNPYYYINNVSIDTTYPINETPTLISPESTIVNQFLIAFGTPETTDLVVTKNGVSTTFSYAASPSGAQFNTAETLKSALLSVIGVKSDLIGTSLIINDAFAQGVSAITENSAYLTISTTTAINNNTLIEKVSGNRYGNRSKVRMEIRYGKDDSVFTLSRVYIDYLKAPQFVRLTQEQVDMVEDRSQLLEFPDYVCQEITNELIKLLLENSSDPRLQTNIPISQSIASPAQEQPQQGRK